MKFKKLFLMEQDLEIKKIMDFRENYKLLRKM